MPLNLSFPECKMGDRVDTVTSKPLRNSALLSIRRPLSPPRGCYCQGLQALVGVEAVE